MKRKKYEALDAENKVIWDKIREVFEDHGALETFKAMLTGIRDTKYRDLTIEEIIETIFKPAKSYTYLEYLDDSHLEQIAEEIDLWGNYRVFKIDSLAQEIKFDNFLSDISENPYQISLIA